VDLDLGTQFQILAQLHPTRHRFGWVWEFFSGLEIACNLHPDHCMCTHQNYTLFAHALAHPKFYDVAHDTILLGVFYGVYQTIWCSCSISPFLAYMQSEFGVP
jgi:hypothetical protein